MLITYDPAKSQRNEEERGLPFTAAENFDWSGALVVEGAVHVISLGRANRRERTRYAAQTQP